MKYALNKRTVVLTGASGGFGREIAKRLILSHGCRVVGIGRNEDKMAALKEELKDKKELFSYKLFDVSDRAAWTDFAENLDCEPSVLINCAGILPEFKSFEKQSEESVFRVTEVNYLSAVTAIRHMMPKLTHSRDPMIVNISSSSALCPVAGAAAYSASKAAFKSFSEALTAELDGKVRVFTVCPGFSITGIFRAQTEKMPERSIMKYFSTPPEKVAQKVVRGMERGRKRLTCGADAKLMNIGHRTAPTLTLKLMRKILIKSGEPMFKDI